MRSTLFLLILFLGINSNSQIGTYVDSHFGIYGDSINGSNTRKITNYLDEFIIIKDYKDIKVGVEINENEEQTIEKAKTIESATRDYQEFTKYLFYNKNSKLFVKKFDNFGEYNPIEIKNDFIFPFLNKNIRKIKKEKIKNYFVKTVSIDNKTKYEQLIVPAPIYTEIYLRAKNINSITKYHFFDMENENNENVNFEENMKLKVIKLEIMCKNEIEKLEKSKRFVRI